MSSAGPRPRSPLAVRMISISTLVIAALLLVIVLQGIPVDMLQKPTGEAGEGAPTVGVSDQGQGKIAVSVIGKASLNDINIKLEGDQGSSVAKLQDGVSVTIGPPGSPTAKATFHDADGDGVLSKDDYITYVGVGTASLIWSSGSERMDLASISFHSTGPSVSLKNATSRADVTAASPIDMGEVSYTLLWTSGGQSVNVSDIRFTKTDATELVVLTSDGKRNSVNVTFKDFNGDKKLSTNDRFEYAVGPNNTANGYLTIRIMWTYEGVTFQIGEIKNIIVVKK